MKLLKPDYLKSPLFVINKGGDEIYTEADYQKEKDMMQMRFPEATSYEIPDTNLPAVTKQFNPYQENGRNDRINAISNNGNLRL